MASAALSNIELTTDPETLPKECNWCVMTHIPNLKYHQVTLVWFKKLGREYGLKQSNAGVGMGRFS